MKCILATVLLGVILSYVVAEEVITFEDFTEDIKSHIKECEEEKNVKKEDCLKQWKESKGKELSEGCKCMVKCVGNKADVMDDKGHVIEANLKKHVDKMTDQKKKEMVEKIIEDCKDKGEDIEDPCEAANKVMGCSIMSYMSHRKKDE